MPKTKKPILPISQIIDPISTAEAGQRINRTRVWVSYLCKNEQLKCARIGLPYLVDSNDLERYRKEHCIELQKDKPSES